MPAEPNDAGKIDDVRDGPQRPAPIACFSLIVRLFPEVWAEFGDGVKGEAAYRGGA